MEWPESWSDIPDCVEYHRDMSGELSTSTEQEYHFSSDGIRASVYDYEGVNDFSHRIRTGGSFVGSLVKLSTPSTESLFEILSADQLFVCSGVDSDLVAWSSGRFLEMSSSGYSEVDESSAWSVKMPIRTLSGSLGEWIATLHGDAERNRRLKVYENGLEGVFLGKAQYELIDPPTELVENTVQGADGVAEYNEEFESELFELTL